MATDVFNSKNLAVQAQKKILGKMVSKSIATTLIDDTSSDVLDELYRVTKEYTHNKKEAEKIIKNLIKTVIKLAILYRNNQFNQDELALMEKFKKKVHQLAMTVVSFYQVDYTFDRNVLSRLLNECREMLHQIIQRHLTAKSHGRVNNVFDHFSDCEFLAALYNPFGTYKPHLQKLCEGINKMLDEGNIWMSSITVVTASISYEWSTADLWRKRKLKPRVVFFFFFEDYRDFKKTAKSVLWLWAILCPKHQE